MDQGCNPGLPGPDDYCLIERHVEIEENEFTSLVNKNGNKSRLKWVWSNRYSKLTHLLVIWIRRA